MNRLVVEHLAERGDYRCGSVGCKETRPKGENLADFNSEHWLLINRQLPKARTISWSMGRYGATSG